jgi:hypothetical protein
MGVSLICGLSQEIGSLRERRLGRGRNLICLMLMLFGGIPGGKSGILTWADKKYGQSGKGLALIARWLLGSGSRWSMTGCGIARLAFVDKRMILALTDCKLGSSSLYPQGPYRPRPSDNGRHVVKLLLNGAWRGVVIDSLLPYSESTSKPLHATTQPISSPHSTSIGPPWIPLATKAYFKALGGYTVQGSDPGPDIYAFTGWIPERLSLKEGFQREKEWKRIYKAWKSGKVLVTLGTGKVVQKELVPFHAYGVIGLREEKGERVLEIVDPGSTPRQPEGVLEESMNQLSLKPTEGRSP